MNTRIIEERSDRIVIERTVLQALSVIFVDKRVTLPRVTMHVKALEERNGL
jgi:hypothetical protein